MRKKNDIFAILLNMFSKLRVEKVGYKKVSKKMSNEEPIKYTRRFLFSQKTRVLMLQISSTREIKRVIPRFKVCITSRIEFCKYSI